VTTRPQRRSLVSMRKNKLTYVGISGNFRSVLTFVMNWSGIARYLFRRSFHSYGKVEAMIGSVTVSATLMPLLAPTFSPAIDPAARGMNSPLSGKPARESINSTSPSSKLFRNNDDKSSQNIPYLPLIVLEILQLLTFWTVSIVLIFILLSRSSGKNYLPTFLDTTRATLKSTHPTILLLLRVYSLPPSHCVATIGGFVRSRCLATIRAYTYRHTDFIFSKSIYVKAKRADFVPLCVCC
jgi:hypothetical protein